MAEFQWKADADQTFDSSYGNVILQGKSGSFDKGIEKLFTLNTDNSLTLSEGPNPSADNEQTWNGEFHLVKGTFNVGSKDQPIGSLTMYGEKEYSRPEYTLFRSRASFNAFALTQILINGPDVDHDGKNPVISLFANSRTSLTSPKNGDRGGVFLNKTTLNLEGDATLSIHAGLFELDNSTVSVINGASVMIGFDSFVARHKGSDGCFNLGGFVGESDNNVTNKANITFDTGIDFLNHQYPKAFFNFNTKDVNNKDIANKGAFRFLGSFNAFQVKAMLQQQVLAINGVPVVDQNLFSILYQDPVTKEPALIVSLGQN